MPLSATYPALLLGLLCTICLSVEERSDTTQPAGDGAPLERKADEVRVLSYNIHHGRGTDDRIDLERIARIIRESGADLVALQEVDKGTGRANGVDQAKELAKLTGMRQVFGKAIDFSGGEYGNALLSRFPIKAQAVIPLPTAPQKEDRAAVMIEVEVKGTTLALVGTHLSHEKDSAEERRKAFKLIREAVKKTGAPHAILAGDFNAEPQSGEMKELREHWTLTGDALNLPTWSADKPEVRIDYICLNRGSRLMAKAFRVIDERVASDHRPVLAVFELPGGRQAE